MRVDEERGKREKEVRMILAKDLLAKKITQLTFSAPEV